MSGNTMGISYNENDNDWNDQNIWDYSMWKNSKNYQIYVERSQSIRGQTIDCNLQKTMKINHLIKIRVYLYCFIFRIFLGSKSNLGEDWWHCYVGDFMMLTNFSCWWQNHYVGDIFRYVGDFHNILNRSPTSWVGHQHLRLVTNTFGLQHPSPTTM